MLRSAQGDRRARSLATGIVIAALSVSIAASQGRGQLARTTPFFHCGMDALVPFPVPVSWQTIALAADRRLYVPCPVGTHDERHREMRDAQVLDDATRSTIALFRRSAVAAYGRLGRPEFVGMNGAPGVLIRALDDVEPLVRMEAASAIADALAGVAVEPDDTGAHPATTEQINFARTSLQAHLLVEKKDDVAGMFLETLGRLKYTDDPTRDDVETTIVARAEGTPVRMLGAAKGLESFTRANPRRPLQNATRDLLHTMAVTGPTGTAVATVAGAGTAEAPGDDATLARVRRLAMQSMQNARDVDVATIVRAARDGDWQVRRLAALRLDPAQREMAGMREQLAVDPAFQVRYEVVGVEATLAAVTHDCDRLLKAFDDRSTTVVLRAIDRVPTGCANGEAVNARLMTMAGDVVRGSATAANWHVPIHAMLTLQRLSPAKLTSTPTAGAAPLLTGAANNSAWQVRASAATIAGLRKDMPLLLRLAADTHPNVRTAALEAIGVEKSDDIVKAEILALDSPDHQLVRAAANALKSTPEQYRDDVNIALLASLTRLTKRAADTSRDPRVAILQRLQELLPSEWTTRLTEYADDFDPKVRAAAHAAYRAIIHADMPVSTTILHRYPLQPTDAQLGALPSHATIRVAGLGVIEMDLLLGEAPITVARFVELVRGGHYNGLTFHRVVPNFVIQGGSPGANEYVGVDRFWRDEIGTVPHTRGAVGISTRGRDTGDGQIFIDLVDLPRLDHDYTVFARITAGLDVADRVLEGARIESITVR